MDVTPAIATIVAAFADDPVERWLYPQEAEYLEHFPRFVEAFAGAGTVSAVEDFAAVAVWLPPGAEPDGDAIGAVYTATVDPAKHDDVFAVAGQMDDAHPRFAHWYLPWLAVRPERQGAGLGAALLREGLARVDADGLPAYLETPNPRTIPLYERHGFAVTAVAQAGECPPVTCMLRTARTAAAGG
jgi:ribosomal protein S18 acetylase RimI-like enzyme